MIRGNQSNLKGVAIQGGDPWYLEMSSVPRIVQFPQAICKPLMIVHYSLWLLSKGGSQPRCTVVYVVRLGNQVIGGVDWLA